MTRLRRLFLRLSRLCRFGWCSLLGEQKPDPEHEVQHLDSFEKVLRCRRIFITNGVSQA